MSKRKRHASDVRRISDTVVPMLITVGLAAGVAASGLVDLSPAAYAANPCAAKNPCNPCAAKNPCNPCAANPCNPCGGGSQSSNTNCVVPRLAAAAKSNPCAAKKSCTPCAANPCAAKANPCNPCAAAAEPAELTAAEAVAAYDCMIKEMKAAYVKSGLAVAKEYVTWPSFNLQPYVSGTHGQRYVNNYANKTAKAYGKFEKSGKMAVGSMLAKDSFMATPDGKLAIGPLFLMEKMKAGFDKASGDWRYTLIGPDGTVIGETKGKGTKNVEFCAECHATAGDTQDHMFFMPDEIRKSAK